MFFIRSGRYSVGVVNFITYPYLAYLRREKWRRVCRAKNKSARSTFGEHGVGPRARNGKMLLRRRAIWMSTKGRIRLVFYSNSSILGPG